MNEKRHKLGIFARLISGVVIARRPKADAAISNRSNGGDCHGPKGPRNDAYSFNFAGALGLALAISMVVTQAGFAESARTLTRSGNELYGDGNFNEAINRYDTALVEMPQAPEPKLNKANSYYRLDDLAKAMDLYKEVAADTKEMDLVAKAKYNLGNCYFQQGSKQRDSDLQKALDDFKTSITFWRGVLDIEPENKKAAKNIEVARLTIKDILDQINKQQDPNQPQDPNQSQQQQNQQRQDQNQQNAGQDPNQPQDPNQAQKANQGQDPNESLEPNQPDQQQQQNKQEKEQQSVAPDATAQEILDKEQQQKEQRQILQRGRYQKVERDW